MEPDYIYLFIVTILLVAIAVFYFSPFEFTIEEERD
jgi:hypothetical protein